MAFADFLIGRAPEYDHDDDQLAKPFPGEADDLKIHAEVCAMRYGRIMQGQAKADLAHYDLRAFIVKAFLAGFFGIALLLRGGDAIELLSKVM